MARNDSFRGNFAEWMSLFGSSLFSVGKMEGTEKNVEINRCILISTFIPSAPSSSERQKKPKPL